MKKSFKGWIAGLLAIMMSFQLALPISMAADEATNAPATMQPIKTSTIAAARQESKDSIVQIQGIITSVIGNNAFIEDTTGGIYLYAGANAQADFVVGKEVMVTGTLAEFNGLMQLKNILSVTSIKDQQTLPLTSIGLDQIGESYEGKRIQLKNVTITGKASVAGGYNITVVDPKGNEGVLRLDRFVKDKKAIYDQYQIKDIINVTAPLGEFRKAYQLMLSTASDITLVTRPTTPVEPPAASAKIEEIQGISHQSPFMNKTVTNVSGVITAVVKSRYDEGFYMQDTKSTSTDNRASKGIYVNTKNLKTKAVYGVGDLVAVSGTVTEKYTVPKSMQKGNLTVTQLDASDLTTVAQNQPLPAPIIIGEGGFIPPTIIDNDGFKNFDPEQDAIDFYESLECMRVLIKKPVVTGIAEKYGEIAVVVDGGQHENYKTPSGGIRLTANSYPSGRLLIDDVLVPITGYDKRFKDKKYDIKVGDKFSQDIIAVVSYGFGNYKFYNTEPLPSLMDGGLKRKATTIEPKEDQLTVAEYNIENFSVATATQEKVKQLGESFVHDLKAPDIIALVEVQDDDGPDGNNKVVDATKSGQALIDAIKAVDNKLNYKYTDIAPVNDMDGGQPGGNIRVGYLYNADRVTLVDKGAKGGSSEEAVVTSSGLTKNPMRLGTASDAFERTRKPLVAEFMFQGEKVFIINNHFSSKRGDGYEFGSEQPVVKGSEPNRHKQAQLVNDFVDAIEGAVDNAKVVVLGDLNDYDFSQTVKVLEGSDGALYNKVKDLPENQRYNYIYSGVSQVLDNALVSPNLIKHSTLDFVHINAEFIEAQGRTSDHDPLVLQLDLKNAGTTPPVTTPDRDGDIIRPTTDIEIVDFGSISTSQDTIKVYINSSVSVEKDDLNIDLDLNKQSTIDVKIPSGFLASRGFIVKTNAFTLAVPKGSVDDNSQEISFKIEKDKVYIATNYTRLSDQYSFSFTRGNKALTNIKPLLLTLNTKNSPLRQGLYHRSEKDNWFPLETPKSGMTFEVVTGKDYALLGHDKIFADLRNHWSETTVETLAVKGIIDGITSNRFAPDQKITRSQFTKLLVASMDLKEGEHNSSFKDVNKEDWFYKDVMIASSLGIVKGDGRYFRPEDTITRQEMAVMISRSLAHKTASLRAPSQQFIDQIQIAPWAMDAVNDIVKKGIVQGYEDQSFRPLSNATRSEAATMIYRLLSLR